MTTHIPPITIDELITTYDALLFDAYGVLIDASGALPGAVELMARLNANGTPYYILTNDASRLPTRAAQRYQQLGLAIAEERIITSGSMLAPYFAEQGLAGASCVVLGTADSRRYVELAGGVVVEPTDSANAAVIAVCDDAGFSFLETLHDVLTLCYRRVDAGQPLHLLVPNPDLIYPRGPQAFGIASGSIGMILEAALQLRYPGRADLRAIHLGKPAPAMFAEAERRSGTRHMVMIGDQLPTDIRGANAFGIDSVLVTSGVTQAPTPSVTGPKPTYLLTALCP